MKVVGRRSKVAREKSLYNAGGVGREGGKMTLRLRLAFLRYYISSVLWLFAAGTIKPKNLLFFFPTLFPFQKQPSPHPENFKPAHAVIVEKGSFFLSFFRPHKAGRGSFSFPRDN